MSKSISYSKFTSSYLSFFRTQKKLYKHGIKAPGCPTFEDFHIKVTSELFAMYKKGIIEYRDLIPIFYVDSILFTGCENYYIETMDLYNFLRDTPVKETSKIIKKIIKSDRIRGDGGSGLKATDCLIHYPDASKCSVYSLLTNQNNISGVGIAFGRDDVADVSLDKLNEPWPNPNKDTEEAQKTINMVINLFMYMDCFPECVSDDAPEQITQDRKINGKHKTITTHESIIDRSGVSPHFRRGYFKCLTSEYFTKKRGQVIFIHSTFVKGTAKTVLDSQSARQEMAAV